MEQRRFSREDCQIELQKLREAARAASIYHKRQQAFRRNPNLAHIAHASLHCGQFLVALAIEIFHHVHHSVNKSNREDDETVPVLPEERNPIFFIYPLCMTLSLLFAGLWLCKKGVVQTPELCLFGCFAAAFLMLLAGIIEMKHADTYLDLSEISDEELLDHPVFIHNFIMCILSIFCMTLYLVQGWILLDHLQWRRKLEGKAIVSPEGEDSSSKTRRKGQGTDRYGKKTDEEPGELNPIPTLDSFPTMRRISHPLMVEEEPAIIYCCFVDCFNYYKHHGKSDEPVHEFQVIHVM